MMCNIKQFQHVSRPDRQAVTVARSRAVWPSWFFMVGSAP